MKRKQSNKRQTSQPKAKKGKMEDIFPIDTFTQNPGFQLVARNIFKNLELNDFSNCRLVSKAWKQFIDEDKSLANKQFDLVLGLYLKKVRIDGSQ